MIYENHYTYRITNLLINKHYYGTRSTNINPKDDLGIIYFSSSTNKEFILAQKENTHNYKYKIIKIYKTRKDAIKLEIKLHNKFNVGVNDNFYNNAKQISTGFDTTGTFLTKEHKEKLSKSLSGRIFSEEHRKKLSEAHKGRIFSDEHKRKISKNHARSNLGGIMSEYNKRKLSEVNKGTPKSEEAKRKMSLSAKNRKKIKCPHCDKLGDVANMKRWHFDNCKFKVL